VFDSDSVIFTIPGILRRPLDGTDQADRVLGDPRTGGWIQNGFYDQTPVPISLRGGNDRLRAVATADRATGLLAFGLIDTGGGHDRLIGSGARTGVQIAETALRTGPGRDRLTGVGDDTAIAVGILRTGSGGDWIQAFQGRTALRPQIGLSIALGQVNTGQGADRVRAWGRRAGLTQGDGGLATAAGNDLVDVRHGGLTTDAFSPVRLGQGNDRFIGFATAGAGRAELHGGVGRDTLVLPRGTYRILGSVIEAGDASLRAISFERLAGLEGGVLPFAAGSLVVDGGGIRWV
jgi:hypothetical protein